MNFNAIKQEFSKKPYHLKNDDYNRLAKNARILFQVICVVFGFLFVMLNIDDMVHNVWASSCLSVVALVAIEGAKQVLTINTFKLALIYGFKGIEIYIKLILTIAIIAFSIFISKSGIEAIYIAQNNAPSVIDLDSIIRPFSIQIENAKNDTAMINRTMVYWGEKQLTSEGRKMLVSATLKIDKIQHQIDSATTCVNTANSTALQQYRICVQQKAKKLSWFVVVVDCLLVVSLLYPTYYRYNSLKEWEQKKHDDSMQNDEKTDRKNDCVKDYSTPTPYEEGQNDAILGNFDVLTNNVVNEPSEVQQNNNVVVNAVNVAELQQVVESCSIPELQRKRRTAIDGINRAKKRGNFETSKAAQRDVVLLELIEKKLSDN